MEPNFGFARRRGGGGMSALHTRETQGEKDEEFVDSDEVRSSTDADSIPSHVSEVTDENFEKAQQQGLFRRQLKSQWEQLPHRKIIIRSDASRMMGKRALRMRDRAGGGARGGLGGLQDQEGRPLVLHPRSAGAERSTASVWWGTSRVRPTASAKSGQ